MSESPLYRLLTPGGCRMVNSDVAVHWFPERAEPGSPCFCGSVTRSPEDCEEAAQAAEGRGE